MILKYSWSNSTTFEDSNKNAFSEAKWKIVGNRELDLLQMVRGARDREESGGKGSNKNWDVLPQQ